MSWKTGVKILLGCLAAPFVLVLLLGVLALVFRAMPLRPSEARQASVDRPVERILGVSRRQLAAEGLDPGRGLPAGAAMRVSIALEEGNFTIQPGPDASRVAVRGDYDSGVYELRERVERDASGRPVYNLTFRPRYSLLRRILTRGFARIDGDANKLTVYLPKDLPIDLDVKIRKGESRLHLGGLALESVTLELKMGEHTLTVDEPNPIDMSRLEIDVGMGEVKLLDLGNLRAGDIAVWGKMGEIRVDLGRGIFRDTRLHARMRMGEMRLGLPRQARITRRTGVFLGEAAGAAREAGEREDATGPRLEVDAAVSLGSLRYYGR